MLAPVYGLGPGVMQGSFKMPVLGLYGWVTTFRLILFRSITLVWWRHFCCMQLGACSGELASRAAKCVARLEQCAENGRGPDLAFSQRAPAQFINLSAADCKGSRACGKLCGVRGPHANEQGRGADPWLTIRSRGNGGGCEQVFKYHAPVGSTCFLATPHM